MIRLTKRLLSNVQIIASDHRDRQRPRLCKVVAVDPETGARGDVLSDDHKDAEAARRWIETEKTMAPEE